VRAAGALLVVAVVVEQEAVVEGVDQLAQVVEADEPGAALRELHAHLFDRVLAVEELQQVQRRGRDGRRALRHRLRIAQRDHPVAVDLDGDRFDVAAQAGVHAVILG
jgi:hypothetical protein